MKKPASFLILLCVTLTVLPCGGDGDLMDSYDFYSLYQQTGIASPAYYPFLRDQYHTFYQDPNGQINTDHHSGNIQLWKKLLVEWTANEIETMVYTDSEDVFQYKGELIGNNDEYKQSFNKLRQYEDMKFYDRIIEECSFFRYYTSL